VTGFTCFYYLTESGRSPVREFISFLDHRTRRKFFFEKGLLEQYGPKLAYPYARYIGKSIFELRLKSHEGAVRILYFFFHRDKIIFTNGFIKKSNRTPKSEILIATGRRKNFLDRQKEGDVL